MYTAFRKSKHIVATFGKQQRENAVQPLLIGTSHCKLQILRAIFANSAQHSTRFFYGTMVCDTGVLSRVSWLVRPPVKLRVSIQFTLSLRVLKMHCDWRLASTQMSAGVCCRYSRALCVILTAVSERVNKNLQNFRSFCTIW